MFWFSCLSLPVMQSTYGSIAQHYDIFNSMSSLGVCFPSPSNKLQTKFDCFITNKLSASSGESVTRHCWSNFLTGVLPNHCLFKSGIAGVSLIGSQGLLYTCLANNACKIYTFRRWLRVFETWKPGCNGILSTEPGDERTILVTRL